MKSCSASLVYNPSWSVGVQLLVGHVLLVTGELDFWTHGAVSEDKTEQLKLTGYSPSTSMWDQEDSCYEIVQGVSYRKRVWSVVKVQIRICTTTFWFCTWLYVAVCVLFLVFHEMRLECGSCTLPLVLSDSDGARPIQVAAWLLKWVRPKHIRSKVIDHSNY